VGWGLDILIGIIDNEKMMPLHDLGFTVAYFKFILIELQVIISVNMITGHAGKKRGILAAFCITLRKCVICGKGQNPRQQKNSGKPVCFFSFFSSL